MAFIYPSSYEILYYLDGRKRAFSFGRQGDTDGYVTYLGRSLEAEVSGVESPIMDEHVIRLISGEEITIDGNTVDTGGIRFRPATNKT